jgi:transcriptional pleiotropic regulator of transition state genes
MKATGVVRRVDELGRVVIPCELRRNMNIQDRDSLEIFVDEDVIILKKHEPACTFTGSADELVDYKGRKVSKQAIQEMAKLAGLM